MLTDIQIKHCVFVTNTTMLLFHRVFSKTDVFVLSVHKCTNSLLEVGGIKSIIQVQVHHCWWQLREKVVQ